MLTGTNKISNILLIYTGGTIGMIEDEQSKSYLPFSVESVLRFVPRLSELDLSLSVVSFDKPLDSAHVGLNEWLKIKNLVCDNYQDYDGFVILHGTDTMAFSASAVSFLLQGLNKPVIFTGSQLPISKVRSDAHENLVTAIEIAISQKNGKPNVPEVAVFFDKNLYRAVRSTKDNAESFDAFSSPNYPVLATAGVNIKFNEAFITPFSKKGISPLMHIEKNVVVLKLFPGIDDRFIKQNVSAPWVKGIVLETFGTGTVNLSADSIEVLKTAINNGVLIYAVSQCKIGSVEIGKYKSSSVLKEIGVLSGSDITSEAALVKLMVVLGNYSDNKEIENLLISNWIGELTEV